MKKISILLVLLMSLTLSSCMKESEYSITYLDNFTTFANLTVFEYDFDYSQDADVLVACHEIRNVKYGEVFDFTSSDLADKIVVGVESSTSGVVLEWYTNPYQLDPENKTYIDIDFTNSYANPQNPVNPNDCVAHYLHK